MEIIETPIGNFDVTDLLVGRYPQNDPTETDQNTGSPLVYIGPNASNTYVPTWSGMGAGEGYDASEGVDIYPNRYDAFLSYGDITEIDNASSLSFFEWISVPDKTSNVIFLNRDGGSPNRIRVQMIDGVLRIYLTNGGSQYATYDFTSDISDNTFFSLAVTYDGTGSTNSDKLKAFVNGAEKTLTYSGTVPTTTATLSGYGIPFTQGPSSTSMSHKVSHFGLYTDTLTPSEVSALHSLGSDLGGLKGVDNGDGTMNLISPVVNGTCAIDCTVPTLSGSGSVVAGSDVTGTGAIVSTIPELAGTGTVEAPTAAIRIRTVTAGQTTNPGTAIRTGGGTGSIVLDGNSSAQGSATVHLEGTACTITSYAEGRIEFNIPVLSVGTYDLLYRDDTGELEIYEDAIAVIEAQSLNPILTQIEDEIKTLIGGMLQADGYYYDWGTTDTDDMARMTFPAAYVTLEPEESSITTDGGYMYSYENQSMIKIRLWGRLADMSYTPRDDYTTVGNKMTDDIKRLFGIHPTIRGKSCIVDYSSMERITSQTGDIKTPLIIDTYWDVKYIQDRQTLTNLA